MSLPLPKQVEALADHLAPEVRKQAVNDLARLAEASDFSAGSLSRLIDDDRVVAELRSIAAWAVGLIKEAAVVPALERAVLREEPTELAWEAAKALCSLGLGRDLFRRLLFDGNSAEARRMAAYALGRLNGEGTGRDLCRVVATRTEHPAVRGQAAEALAYNRDGAAFEILEAAASDDSDEVRYWAVFALGALGDPRAEPVLRRAQREDRGVLEGWGPIAAEAARALAQVRRPGS